MLNNLLKNIGIWLVIGLVVLTVVKQFDSRQTVPDTVLLPPRLLGTLSGRALIGVLPLGGGPIH